jgi:hypothetical protein
MEERLLLGLRALARVRRSPDIKEDAHGLPSVQQELYIRYLRSGYAKIGVEPSNGRDLYDRLMRFEAFVEVVSLDRHEQALFLINLAVGLLTGWAPDVPGIKLPLSPVADTFLNAKGDRFMYKADFDLLVEHGSLMPQEIPLPDHDLQVRVNLWRSPIDRLSEVPPSGLDSEVKVSIQPSQN